MSLALAMLGGCTLLAPPQIELTGVTPEWGYLGEPTDIRVAGERFYPSVVVDGADEDGGRIEGAFQVWLETDPPTALTGVQHRGYDELSAEVPAGLDPGVYDLRVRAPSGVEATLPDAFTVTETRADHLQLEVSTAAWEVGEYAPLRVQLMDPEGDPVAQQIAVTITADSAERAAGIAFLGDGLEDQQDVDGGVTGTLAPDGSALILVTSTLPDDVTFTVEAVDDTVVRDDTLLLSWDPGALADVRISLPRGGFRTVAGDEFEVEIALLDALGNELTDLTAALVLYEECGDWLETVTVRGSGTVSLTLTQACAENHIGAFATTGLWMSDTFTVLAGETAGYQVEATPPTVTAGDHALLVLVEAVDAWGNTVSDWTAPVTLEDDAGGLDPAGAMGWQSCPGFPSQGEARQVCTAALWTAAEQVVVTAADPSGLKGSAAPVSVVPGAPADVLATTTATTVEAGEEFDVSVRVVDAYGNTVEFDPGGTDPVAFSDDTGTIGCTWTGAVSGGQSFVCRIEGADPEDTVGVRVLGLEAALPDPLEVTNGPLAEVEVEPQGTAFTAGTAFSVVLRGYDPWGNAYVEQSDPVVELADGRGSLSPTSATLGSDGTTTASVTVTTASPSTTITASQGGVVLGESRTIAVSPAAMVAFVVDAPPWLAVGEASDVWITAVDAYDNPITPYDGPVTLSSRSGRCDDVVVDAFDGGTGVAEVLCDEAGLSDVLEAEDADGFAGSSDSVDVVDFGCAAGPTAALTAEGDTEAVVCLSAGVADVDLDASGSVAGGSGILLHHFADTAGNSARTLSTGTTFSYAGAGAWRVEGVVVDGDACADLAEAVVYLGEDDGEPVGPIDVSASDSTVASGGSVSVSVAARDCTGDVAAGQTVRVRADLGTPAGTSTGEGLAVTLDANGAGSFAWSFPTGYADDGTVWVGATDGGAVGSATVTVSQDGVRPIVVSMSPTGRTLAVVENLRIELSEALYAGNIGASTVTLVGPSGTVATTASLSSDGTVLTAVPASTVDGAAGTWTVTLSSNVRDRAGNKLDGTWSGGAAAFTGTFGDVADAAPEMTSCAADTGTITPDGDDGGGAEADGVTITPLAASTPAWWAWQVADSDGARVRSGRAAGTDATFEWDGRGDDGIVAASGTYTLRVVAEDASGNQSAACEVDVALAQHVEDP